MELVGAIMEDVNSESFAPVIGIATWGIVEDKSKLVLEHEVGHQGAFRQGGL